MIDTTIVRAHACSAGYRKDSQEEKALGHSKGGFTTKIHAFVDALGNPLKFILTPGQRNDVTQGDILVEGLQGTIVIADKGYDSNAFIQKYDKHLYKERYPVECFFGKIKHFRI